MVLPPCMLCSKNLVNNLRCPQTLLVLELWCDNLHCTWRAIHFIGVIWRYLAHCLGMQRKNLQSGCTSSPVSIFSGSSSLDAFPNGIIHAGYCGEVSKTHHRNQKKDDLHPTGSTSRYTVAIHKCHTQPQYSVLQEQE